jgi:hypothetical protein
MKKTRIVLLCMVGLFACKQEKKTFTLDGHFMYKGILTEPTKKQHWLQAIAHDQLT